jgi:hypothetical protein
VTASSVLPSICFLCSEGMGEQKACLKSGDHWSKHKWAILQQVLQARSCPVVQILREQAYPEQPR